MFDLDTTRNIVVDVFNEPICKDIITNGIKDFLDILATTSIDVDTDLDLERKHLHICLSLRSSI